MASAFALLPYEGSPLGTDGQFIPFAVNIGSSGARILAYPSTLAYGIYALDQTVCRDSPVVNCSDLRGSPYNVNNSVTYSSFGSYPVTIETQYGWGKDSGETGIYGTDNIRLATSRGAVGVSGVFVGTMFSRNTGLGLFGLGVNTGPSTQTSGSTNSANTTLQLLRSVESIPSLSYSYTAGIANFKRASLVLGGYDANSFTPNNVNFPFDLTDASNYAKVILQSIATNSAGNTTTLSSPAIQVNIDSTISPLWLPGDTCDAFASAFGLEYNDGTLLYTMNATALANNDRNNASVSFTIGKQTVGGETVTITLPWRAFRQTFYDPNNLSISYQYFPLRRARFANQYALGRTFLQSAVLTVDHERKNFSVAQVNDLSAPGYSVSYKNITSASDNASPTGPTLEPSPASGGSNVGAIAGGVIAGLLVIAAILGFLFWRRRRNRRRQAGIDSAEPHTPGPQPLQHFPNEKTLANGSVEMDTPRPGASEDYFGAYSPGAVGFVADRRGHTKQAGSGASSELDGEQRGGAYSPAPSYGAINEHAVHNGPLIAGMTSQSLPAGQPAGPPAELPAGLNAQELHSRHVSSTSALPLQGTFFSPASSTMQSPISELAPSPGDDHLDTLPFDSDVRPPAQQISLSPTRGAASLRDISRNRSGSSSNPAGTGNSHVSGAMSATSGPMIEGLGLNLGDRPGVSESLRRNDSTKSSKGSGSTLVHNDGLGSSTTTALQSAPRAPIQE